MAARRPKWQQALIAAMLIAVMAAALLVAWASWLSVERGDMYNPPPPVPTPEKVVQQ